MKWKTNCVVSWRWQSFNDVIDEDSSAVAAKEEKATTAMVKMEDRRVMPKEVR